MSVVLVSALCGQSNVVSVVLVSALCGQSDANYPFPRPLAHRSAPVRDHVGHDGRQGAARGQALEKEAQQVEPVRDERVGDVKLLQHVGEGILEAVAGGAHTRSPHMNDVNTYQHHVNVYVTSNHTLWHHVKTCSPLDRSSTDRSRLMHDLDHSGQIDRSIPDIVLSSSRFRGEPV